MTLFDSSFEQWVVKNTGRSLELARAIQAGQGLCAQCCLNPDIHCFGSSGPPSTHQFTPACALCNVQDTAAAAWASVALV